MQGLTEENQIPAKMRVLQIILKWGGKLVTVRYTG